MLLVITGTTTPHVTVDKLFAIDKACNGNAGVGVSHGCTCLTVMKIVGTTDDSTI